MEAMQEGIGNGVNNPAQVRIGSRTKLQTLFFGFSTTVEHGNDLSFLLYRQCIWVLVSDVQYGCWCGRSWRACNGHSDDGIGGIQWIGGSGAVQVAEIHDGKWRCVGWRSRLSFMRIWERATRTLMVRQGGKKRRRISIAGVFGQCLVMIWWGE